ncbi:MAG: pyridoxal phosphate-dependent aminotransferase family protein [Bacteroidetes bacterium]|nr:pyridoxal phosphate-dependent aminotransferase family protein [Bacteroidota bacterium]
MNFSATKFLIQSLEKREMQNALRRLTVNSDLVDFCSNDYLGFSKSIDLKNKIQEELNSFSLVSSGSGGSRLLAGNTDYAEKLERKIASFHKVEARLLFNSGYDANIGLFSALGQKEDTIIYDELIHASVHDGMKLSQASCFLFKHNDLAHLEERLKIAKGNVFVAIESIYSMDGDYAPLSEIVQLCAQYNANLIVDEAHATGVTENIGKGRVQALGLEKSVFARLHTFGKGLGCHGAIILGNVVLRNYLINYSRAFIYTTALPMHSLVAINQAYNLLLVSQNKIDALQELICYFKEKICGIPFLESIDSQSAIQCIVVSGNDKVKNIAKLLQQDGLDIRPILSPTVPKGKERLRICLHVFNSKEEIDRLAYLLNKHLPTINS